MSSVLKYAFRLFIILGVVAGVSGFILTDLGLMAVDADSMDIELQLDGGNANPAPVPPTAKKRTPADTPGEQAVETTRRNSVFTDTPVSTPVSTDRSTRTPTPTPEPPCWEDVAYRDLDDPGATTAGVSSAGVSSSKVEQLVHEKVNARRARYGLSNLTSRESIASVARAHSQDLHAREYFAHTNPDGETPAERYGAEPNLCQSYGENIVKIPVGVPYRSNYRSEALSVTTPDEIATAFTRAWMNSTGHRRNILRSSWTDSGVGVYLGEKDGTTWAYATQNFCHSRVG